VSQGVDRRAAGVQPGLLSEPAILVVGVEVAPAQPVGLRGQAPIGIVGVAGLVALGVGGLRPQPVVVIRRNVCATAFGAQMLRGHHAASLISLGRVISFALTAALINSSPWDVTR